MPWKAETWRLFYENASFNVGAAFRRGDCPGQIHPRGASPERAK